MDNNIARVECIIRGRVQMVMYRDFVCRKARKFNIVGCVKNLNDGSISVIAEGGTENISNFLKLLHTGPLFAKVDSIDIHYRKSTSEFNDFKIIYEN